MTKKTPFFLYLPLLLLLSFSCQSEDIEVPITNLEISLLGDYMEVGEADTINLVIYPEDATNKNYIYSSSDESIAEVSADGVVKGVSPGKAVIKVTTSDGGFSTSKNVQIVRWTYYFSEKNVHVRPVAVDRNDKVWSGGIELTSIANNNMLEVKANIGHISAIAVNNDIRWFGTESTGLWKYDGAKWTNYTESNSELAYNSINPSAMMVDEKGYLWLGTSNSTYGTGLTMFDGREWHTFNSDNGLVYNHVMDMATDKNGLKWFATGKGISSFDDAQWTSYTSKSTGIEFMDQVFSVAVDKDNNKWFGSYMGVLKFDGGKWTHYDILNSDMQWNTINAIAVDNNNNIWLTTEGGVSKFDGTNWMNYTCKSQKDLHLHNVRAIDIDSKGDVWLGTSYALVKLEMGQ